MEDEEKIPLLKNKYLVLQKAYEDFGARLMTIKGWSATVAIAHYGRLKRKYYWGSRASERSSTRKIAAPDG